MKSVGVVLAAGFGTRLRPSTLHCPKPLIPVAGVEPLFFALHRFYELGVRTVFINTHHLEERVKEKVSEWKKIFHGLEMILSHEEKILGTGGALLKIFSEHPEHFKNAQMILQNGDTLAGIDLTAFRAGHGQNLFAVSFLPEHLKKYKPLWVDSAKLWTGIGKTPPTPHSRPAHFLGIHSLSPRAVETLQAMLRDGDLRVEEQDLFNGIYRPLVDRGFRFEAVEFFRSERAQDFWFDMTSKEFLLEAQKYLLTNLAQLPQWSSVIERRHPGTRQISPGFWSHAQAPQFIKVEVPSLLLLKQSDSLQSSGGQLTLGPHSALIFEGKELTLNLNAKNFSIENALIFVQNSSAQNGTPSLSLSDHLKGDLLVQ